MEYQEIKNELDRFAIAGINVTVGQFARYINAKKKEVVIKPYRFKILDEISTARQAIA